MITQNGKITYSQTNLIKDKRNEWTDVMQWCKLITSFGIKHELFNIGFNFQRIKKNGFVIVWFYCLIKFYMIRFPFFYALFAKGRFFPISFCLSRFKDTGANPLIVSRDPIRAVRSSGSVSLLMQGARVERLSLLEFLKPTSYWKFHEGGKKLESFIISKRPVI